MNNLAEKSLQEIESESSELEWVSKYAPCFQVDSEKIFILREPSEFYSTLNEQVAQSKNRIVLSSLYLGTGELEKDLVQNIQNSLANNTDLRVKVLLDYSRGLRGEKNSKTMLQHLISRYTSEQRMNLSLYHTPSLRGVIKKLLPERTNETIGVFHMKMYLFDNNLIISGANLSHDYFTNRQDRYIMIKDCEHLCNFFESLVDCVSDFSFKVNQNGECVYLNKKNLTESNFDLNIMNQEDKQHHPYLSEFDLFCRALGDRVRQVLLRYENHKEEYSESNENTAYVYPLIQINDSSIKTDENVTRELFERAIKPSSIYLAVGYFNLTQEYIESIVRKSSANYGILLSSPEANGFFTAHGFSANIPKFYSYFEEEFFNYCRRFNRNVLLYEYKRDNWTFHAKGLWYYPSHSSHNNLPNMTIIGSSNYGYRSVYKDIEAQILIYSRNKQFQTKIDHERKYLYDNYTGLVKPDLFAHQSRQMSTWLKILAKTIRSYF
jgi:CDP-diacylglycerol--glycerol-3-phosphate 3-phosphatidyltransferase